MLSLDKLFQWQTRHCKGQLSAFVNKISTNHLPEI